MPFQATSCVFEATRLISKTTNLFSIRRQKTRLRCNCTKYNDEATDSLRRKSNPTETARQTNPNPPHSKNGVVHSNQSADQEPKEQTAGFQWVVPAILVGGVITLSAVFKDDITTFLQNFSSQVKEMGPTGYLAYAGLYIVLETVAVPATPLTLAAGYLFGVGPGVAVVSVASTTAATLAFLISRYLLREKVQEYFSRNKQFLGIDRATKKDGFKFVFLLRLSPLLPFAASNYLYGLTSVDLVPYVLASWSGMLPGTWAYISAGSVGREVVEGSSGGLPPWEIFAGLAVTVVVLLITGNLAKTALKEIEEEEN